MYMNMNMNRASERPLENLPGHLWYNCKRILFLTRTLGNVSQI